jgi:replicative superfamily II helicase
MTKRLKNRTVVYTFDDIDGIYTKDDIKNMPMSFFKMFIAFLDKEEFDAVYEIIKTNDMKRFKMEHIYRSLHQA